MKEVFIYVYVFTCSRHTWLNDRYKFTLQFFEEVNDKQNPLQKVKHYFYADDQDFINNCIVYAIFAKKYTNWCLFNNIELSLPNADSTLKFGDF